MIKIEKVTGKNYKEIVKNIIDKGEVILENGKKLSILTLNNEVAKRYTKTIHDDNFYEGLYIILPDDGKFAPYSLSKISSIFYNIAKGKIWN